MFSNYKNVKFEDFIQIQLIRFSILQETGKKRNQMEKKWIQKITHKRNVIFQDI